MPCPVFFSAVAGNGVKDHLRIHYVLIILMELLKTDYTNITDLAEVENLRKRVEGQGYSLVEFYVI